MINFKSFLRGENLKNYCTFSIGGKAKFLFVAKSTKQLVDVCSFYLKRNIKYKIIGEGANLLFSDEGFNGAIIVNKSKKIRIKNRSVYVDSGVNLTSLIFALKNHSLCNFEHLASIPATIGGATINSLSAFGCNFSDYVECIECFHKSNPKKKLIFSNADCKFSYRFSIFKNDEYIITRVKLRLRKSNKFLIQKRIDEAINKKLKSQPIGLPSAGSIFKRCEIIPAKIIDELGLKGTKIGGAEISTLHAGFIVNKDNATSEDVKRLISLIEEKVLSSHNVKLEREIEFVEY